MYELSRPFVGPILLIPPGFGFSMVVKNFLSENMPHKKSKLNKLQPSEGQFEGFKGCSRSMPLPCVIVGNADFEAFLSEIGGPTSGSNLY